MRWMRWGSRAWCDTAASTGAAGEGRGRQGRQVPGTVVGGAVLQWCGAVQCSVSRLLLLAGGGEGRTRVVCGRGERGRSGQAVKHATTVDGGGPGASCCCCDGHTLCTGRDRPGYRAQQTQHRQPRDLRLLAASLPSWAPPAHPALTGQQPSGAPAAAPARRQRCRVESSEPWRAAAALPTSLASLASLVALALLTARRLAAGGRSAAVHLAGPSAARPAGRGRQSGQSQHTASLAAANLLANKEANGSRDVRGGYGQGTPANFRRHPELLPRAVMFHALNKEHFWLRCNGSREPSWHDSGAPALAADRRALIKCAAVVMLLSPCWT
ncbi:hypothetical protein SVAN01_07815 [Stagonosporopsis vannaccii]|nr:hypothetical protein SVAN01_07815 [Stagonosporopsis vannaccii]